MTIKNFVSFAAVFLIVTVGLMPIVYFVSVEVGLAEANEPASDTLVAESNLDRFVENLAFGPGEKLTFDINYGFINAGTASMEVAQLIEFESRPCYQIISRAQSNKFFSSFYRVDDRVESIIDAVGLFSWRFEKNLKEGDYTADRMYTFDHQNQYVVDQADTTEIPPYIQDALSVMYFTRTQDLKVGTSIFVDNYTDGKLYPLEIKVVREETIEVDAGSFDCLVVEPLIRSVGVFKHKGKLTVWLTNDRLKMPVLMKSKILVGSISAELTSYQLGDIEVF